MLVQVQASYHFDRFFISRESASKVCLQVSSAHVTQWFCPCEFVCHIQWRARFWVMLSVAGDSHQSPREGACSSSRNLHLCWTNLVHIIYAIRIQDQENMRFPDPVSFCSPPSFYCFWDVQFVLIIFTRLGRSCCCKVRGSHSYWEK